LKLNETTYNFEVEDFHTYYVGENGTCVHNLNCGAKGKIFDSADDAYSAARKDLRLKPGEKPLEIIDEYYNNGKGFWSNQSIEVYSGNRAIANHSLGHNFRTDVNGIFDVMQPHFNVGIWNYEKGRLISSGFHYFY
jgi:hypothetical protein